MTTIFSTLGEGERKKLEASSGIKNLKHSQAFIESFYFKKGVVQ